MLLEKIVHKDNQNFPIYSFLSQLDHCLIKVTTSNTKEKKMILDS
jgi:hypothetical protein